MNVLTKSLFILMAIAVTVAGAQERWYKYEVGKPYTFIGESKQTIQQSAMGQTRNVKTETNLAYSITVLEYLEDGSMNAQLDVKSAVSFTESDQGLETFGDDLNNKSIPFTIDSEGHITDVDSLVNEFSQQSRGMVNSMIDFLPNLNTDKLEEGESWTVEGIDTSETDGGDIFIERDIEFEVEQTVDINGISALDIKQSGEISYEGEMQSGPQEFTLMGEGTVDGHVYVSKEMGIMVKQEISSKQERVLSPPSNPSVQITITIDNTSKVEWVSE